MPSSPHRADRGWRPGLLTALIGGLLLPLGAGRAEAQVPRLVAEARVGAMIPSGSLANDAPEGGARSGPSFGAGFGYAVRGGLYLRAGFSQHRMECDGGCRGLGTLTATGFDLGLRYAFDAGRVLPWLGVGALPYTVEGAEGQGPDGVRPLSRHTWGFEGGVGMNIVLSTHVHLSPAVRYLALDPRFPDEIQVEMRGWVADVGLVWAF